MIAKRSEVQFAGRSSNTQKCAIPKQPPNPTSVGAEFVTCSCICQAYLQDCDEKNNMGS